MTANPRRPRVLDVTDAEREHRDTQRTRIAWIAGAAALMLAVTVQPLRDTDVWWHLAMGRYIVTHGIPAQEPFSFLVAQHAWVGQQWLYEVLLAGLTAAGGAGLASLAMGIVACAALVVAARSAPAAARPPGVWLAFAILLSGLVMAQVIGVRGQVLSLLGVSIVLFVVTRWREGHTAPLWALPPLFLLWANLHAGFIVGLAILLAALVIAGPLAPAAHTARRPLALALALSALATLLNPAGPALYGYVAETFSNPTLTQLVTEWASPDFHNLWLRLFEAEAVLLVVLWAAGGGLTRWDAVLALVALAATLQAQRNVSLFALIALPQIAVYGHRAWRAHVARRMTRPHLRTLRPAVAAAAAIAVAAASAVTLVPRLTPGTTRAFEASTYPDAAATYVATRFAGKRIYAPDTWGGYLAYRFPTGRVVFLYDETAVFGNDDLQRYLDIHLLRTNWAATVAQEQVTVAIVPAQSQEASAFHELGWTVACRDTASGALVVTAPTGAAAVPALPIQLETVRSGVC